MTLRSLRRAADITQEQLANELGVHPMTISNWETGKTVPPGDLLMRLAAMYGVRAEDIDLNRTAESSHGPVTDSHMEPQE